MIGTITAELLQGIRNGSLETVDTKWLESTPADQLVLELCSSRYRITFQKRQIGRKMEISLARSLRAELAPRTIANALFVSFQVIPVYLDCLMLNIEDNRFTGMSRLSRLTVWAIRKLEPGLALKSAHGFKLDRTPDGWEMKSMRKRTVKLSAEFLRKRGWRFDHLQQLIPVSR